MIITKTLTLVAAPVPPFIGTKVMLNATADSLVWGIDTADPAEEVSDTVRIEWGDGEVYIGPNEIGNLTHTYPGPGVYEVKISDDILNMDFSGRATSPQLCRNFGDPLRSRERSGGKGVARLSRRSAPWRGKCDAVLRPMTPRLSFLASCRTVGLW